jgi:hypothetical protein
MKPVPTNRMLFWTCYVAGTFAPITGALLIDFSRSRLIDDVGFTWSWFLWVFGTGLLIAAAWSVRKILWFRAQEGQRPAWLYRTIGWFAVVQSFIWALTWLRVI